MVDATPEGIEGTLSPERLAFKPVPKPSLADLEAIPLNSHVVVITWPGEQPDIAGTLWDEQSRDEFTEMFQGERDVRAGDVFVFYTAPIPDEDDLVRHVMNMSDISNLDSARPVYSEQDVAEMIRVAARLAASPTPF